MYNTRLLYERKRYARTKEVQEKKRQAMKLHAVFNKDKVNMCKKNT